VITKIVGSNRSGLVRHHYPITRSLLPNSQTRFAPWRSLLQGFQGSRRSSGKTRQRKGVRREVAPGQLIFRNGYLALGKNVINKLLATVLHCVVRDPSQSCIKTQTSESRSVTTHSCQKAKWAPSIPPKQSTLGWRLLLSSPKHFLALQDGMISAQNCFLFIDRSYFTIRSRIFLKLENLQPSGSFKSRYGHSISQIARSPLFLISLAVSKS
jgi:hypothetical protein